MKEQLRETWNTHHRMNQVMVSNITDDAMKISPGNRARTIYDQWVHVHNVRMQWLGISAKEIFQKISPFDQKTESSRDVLVRALDESSGGLTELFKKSWDTGGKIKGFKNGLIPFVG